jgi:transposase-like protein
MPLSSSSLSLAKGFRASHDLAVSPPDAKRPPVAQNVESEARVPRPRRKFTAEQKLRAIEEADACKRGELGIVLRRHGIYASHLVAWRKQLRERGTAGMQPQKPGPKAVHDEKDARIVELEKKLARAEKQLSVAKSVIDFQKKVSVMLGIEMDEPSEKG